jgi:hypothetical protein
VYVFMHDRWGRCRISLHIFALYPALCVVLFLISYKYWKYKITPSTESWMYTVNTNSLRTFSGQLQRRRIQSFLTSAALQPLWAQRMHAGFFLA